MKRDMCWEWNWPRRLGRPWHPVVMFEVTVSASDEGDHTPSVWVILMLFGWMLLDFGIYNRFHADE